MMSRRGRRRTVSSLAQRVRLHCVCTKPRRSRRIFTWRSRPRIAGKSKLSIARLWRRAAKTMVRLVCARTTTRTTMQLSSLVRTGTTSKWFATNPRPDPSLGEPPEEPAGVRSWHFCDLVPSAASVGSRDACGAGEAGGAVARQLDVLIGGLVAELPRLQRPLLDAPIGVPARDLRRQDARQRLPG